MFVHQKQGLFLSVHVDDIKMAGKKQNMAPLWKKMMMNVDTDETTSFVDHAHLGCTQRDCKPNETIIEQFSKMYESRISAGATENLPGLQKPHAAWSCDMEGLAQKCVERYCELANKKVEQLYTRFRILAWMIINSSKRNWNQLESCQKFARKLS